MTTDKRAAPGPADFRSESDEYRLRMTKLNRLLRWLLLGAFLFGALSWVGDKTKTEILTSVAGALAGALVVAGAITVWYTAALMSRTRRK